MASPGATNIDDLTNSLADLQVAGYVLNDILTEVSSRQPNAPAVITAVETGQEARESGGSDESPSAPPVEAVPDVETIAPVDRTAPPPEGSNISDADEFKTRVIQFLGKSCRIVMQSQNGPCPLIAAINALSLQGRIRVRARTINGSPDRITRYDLTQLIASIITEEPENMSEVDLKQHEFAVKDVLEILPSLGRGLEVNLRFNDVKSFEYTPSIAMFDLMDLQLYHTWKVEGEYTEAVGDQTYNQVAEKSLTNTVLRDFLNETRSQITYTGLFAVRDAMRDNSFIILFRNNHFSTVYRRNGQLYVLCTDEGFLSSAAAWEKLQNIEGDSEFTDSEFRPLPTQTSTPETGSSETTNSDFELAKKLQAEYYGAPPPAQNPPPVQNPPPAASTSPPPSRSRTPQEGTRKPPKGNNCNLM